jgi:AcrR family transcriptional regulator
LVRRAQLLNAAEVLFLQDGYNATTMERVAASADVSKATLYKYFADKDELFFELVKQRRLAPDPRPMEELRSTIEQTLVHLKHRGSHADLTHSILRLLTTGAGRRTDVFFRIMAELAFANPALLQRVRRELHQDKSGGFPGLAVEAAAELPAELDGQALMHLLFVAIHGYMWTGDVAFGDERMDPERLASTFATLISAALHTVD